MKMLESGSPLLQKLQGIIFEVPGERLELQTNGKYIKVFAHH